MLHQEYNFIVGDGMVSIEGVGSVHPNYLSLEIDRTTAFRFMESLAQQLKYQNQEIVHLGMAGEIHLVGETVYPIRGNYN